MSSRDEDVGTLLGPIAIAAAVGAALAALTVRLLGYHPDLWSSLLLLVVVPLISIAAVSIWLVRGDRRRKQAESITRWAQPPPALRAPTHPLQPPQAGQAPFDQNAAARHPGATTVAPPARPEFPEHSFRPPTITAPATPRPADDPVVVEVPVPHGEWWGESGGDGSRSVTKRLPTFRRNQEPAPIPPRIASTTRVVQCPKCGLFRLDAELRAELFRFWCRSKGCQHYWEWKPGDSWPDVIPNPTQPTR